jgi:hypothetical protein
MPVLSDAACAGLACACGPLRVCVIQCGVCAFQQTLQGGVQAVMKQFAASKMLQRVKCAWAAAVQGSLALVQCGLPAGTLVCPALHLQDFLAGCLLHSSLLLLTC